MAVEAVLPCIAMKNHLGGYIKYVTNKYVSEDIDSFFEQVYKLVCNSDYCIEVNQYQIEYINSLKEENVNEKFKKYIIESKEYYSLRSLN